MSITAEATAKPTRKPKTKFVQHLSLNPTESKALATVLANAIREENDKASGVTGAIYIGVLEGIVAKLA